MSTPGTVTTEIILQALENESPRAYAARVAYVTMGAGRSIDKVGDQLGIRTGSQRVSRLLEWSRKFDWVESARTYDQTLATLAAQAHTVEYQRAIEQQRAEASKIGGELIATGRTLIGEVVRRRDAMEYKPSDLAVAVKAILAGFDLRAHALDLDKLLPALLGEGRDDA
jgi:hypothetical protein